MTFEPLMTLQKLRLLLILGAAPLLAVAANPSTHAAIAPPSLVWSFTTEDEGIPDVTAGPDGSIYVASTSPYPMQALLTRYDAFGAQLWRRDLPSTTRGDIVAADPAGNVYFAGGTSAPVSIGNHMFLRKYNPAGDLLWGTPVGSALSDWPSGLAVDASGNPYLTNGPWASNYGVPPGGTYSQVRRFNATGGQNWLRGVNTQDGSYPGVAGPSTNMAAVSDDGFLYVAIGNYQLPVPNTVDSKYHLAKLTLDGQVLWTKPLSGNAFPEAIALDSQSNVYAASGMSLVKYDAAGDVIWQQTNNSWSLTSVTIGPDDRIYVAGRKELAPYLAEYDAAGNRLWNVIADQPMGTPTYFYGLAVSGNNLIAAGVFVDENSNWTGNLIQAYQIIPEPSGGFLLAVVFAASAIRLRRGPATSEPLARGVLYSSRPN